MASENVLQPFSHYAAGPETEGAVATNCCRRKLRRSSSLARKIIILTAGSRLFSARAISESFYLQEIIGGLDIDNQPSLRAFKDYRFRGPDLMTVQAEYDRKMCEACEPCKPGLIRTLCSHLGLLLAYDAGKVAFRKTDLDFSGMHQSLAAVSPSTWAKI